MPEPTEAETNRFSLDVSKFSDNVMPRIFLAMRACFPHITNEETGGATFDGQHLLATGLTLIHLGAQHLSSYCRDDDMPAKMTALAQAIMRGDKIYSLPALEN